MTTTPREQWFLASRYGTTAQPGNWWHSLDLMLLSLAGNRQPHGLLFLRLHYTCWHDSLCLCFRDALHSVFDEVIMVDVMDSCDAANLALMKRPDLGVTITKLHCWTLLQYSKCVFMDADTLVRKTIRLKFKWFICIFFLDFHCSWYVILNAFEVFFFFVNYVLLCFVVCRCCPT